MNILSLLLDYFNILGMGDILEVSTQLNDVTQACLASLTKAKTPVLQCGGSPNYVPVDESEAAVRAL